MPKYCRDKGEKFNTRGHHESLFFTWEINCLCPFLFRHVFSQTFLPFFLASRNYHGQAQAAPKFFVGCGRNFRLIHGGWWKLRTLAHTVFWHIKKKTQFRQKKVLQFFFYLRVVPNEKKNVCCPSSAEVLYAFLRAFSRQTHFTVGFPPWQWPTFEKGAIVRRLLSSGEEKTLD